MTVIPQKLSELTDTGEVISSAEFYVVQGGNSRSASIGVLKIAIANMDGTNILMGSGNIYFDNDVRIRRGATNRFDILLSDNARYRFSTNTFQSGVGADATGQSITIGQSRSANGASDLEFYTDTLGGYTARLLRSSGTNGNLTLENTGTGDLIINAADASGEIDLQINSVSIGKISSSGFDLLKNQTTTVASLPAASTAGAGARAFVTDANATTFASIVAGSGSNGVPVYSDGTNWRIG